VTQALANPPAVSAEQVHAGARPKLTERVIELLLLLSAVFSIFITAGIVWVLFSETIPFFNQVSIVEFLTDTQWTPLFADKHFGVLPLLGGTLVTTLIALAVGLPLGTIVAVWLGEFSPARVREWVKPVLELLSAVPTVVLGYFAVGVVSPLIQALHARVVAAFPSVAEVIPEVPTFNMLSAGLVMGVMIVPYISSLSEDAMRAVPMLLREGSYGMGANRVSTALRVVFPAAWSGIGAAYTLGVSRAVGETMIVAIAAGGRPNLTFNPIDEATTVASYIAQVSMGDLPHGSLEYRTIFAAGTTLFVLTLGFNLLSVYLRRRFRQAY
jgi:phosphate transport system permease protein